MSDNELYEDDDMFTDDVTSELGYSEFDWDKLPVAEVELHDSVIDMPLEELEELDLTTATDLVKWAAAQSWAELEDGDRFQAIAMELINGGKNHPALEYGEIGIELINDYLMEERFDEARELLDKIALLVPDDPHFRPRFGAIIDVLSGNDDDGMAAFQTLLDNAGDDAMLVLSIGEDLIAVDKLDEALEVLEKAEELARGTNDEEVLGAIEDARTYLAEARKV